MGEAYQMEPDKVKELLGENGRKQVFEDLAVRKAADFVVENAEESEPAAKDVEASEE